MGGTHGLPRLPSALWVWASLWTSALACKHLSLLQVSSRCHFAECTCGPLVPKSENFIFVDQTWLFSVKRQGAGARERKVPLGPGDFSFWRRRQGRGRLFQPFWKHDQASGPDWLRGEPSMISYYLCSKTNELSVGQQLLGGEFSCSAGMEWSALSWTNWYSVISGEHLAKGVLISHSNYPGRSQSPMC